MSRQELIDQIMAALEDEPLEVLEAFLAFVKEKVREDQGNGNDSQ